MLSSVGSVLVRADAMPLLEGVMASASRGVVCFNQVSCCNERNVTEKKSSALVVPKSPSVSKIGAKGDWKYLNKPDGMKDIFPETVCDCSVKAAKCWEQVNHERIKNRGG